MTTNTKIVRKNQEMILKLERENYALQKNFLKEVTPKFQLDSLLTFIDKSNSLYQITLVGNINSYGEFASTVNSNLNYMIDFGLEEKRKEKYESMLEAEAGMMYMYELTECGKNGKAKKIGAKKEIFTEFEIIDLIKNGGIIEEENSK